MKSEHRFPAEHGTATGMKSATENGKILLIISFCLFTTGLLLLFTSNAIAALQVPFFIAGFVLTFTGMLLIRNYWPSSWGFVPILLIACCARLVLFSLPASDDQNRYLWEGKVQLHGMSPYEISPADPRTEPMRDAIWQGINHKRFTTIYGPFAQLLFVITAFLRYSPAGMKLLILLFDIGTLVLLSLYVKKRHLRIKNLIVYALHPLVLYSFAAEGHLEPLLLCPVAAAFVFHHDRKFGWMFISLGCAVMVKMTALMLIPFFIRKDTLRHALFLLFPLLLAVPYFPGIASLSDVALKFGSEFRFNGCAYTFLSQFCSGPLTLMISAALLGLVFVWNFFLTPDPVKAACYVSVAFLLTSPTAHPWYFTIVALFAVIYPVRSLIILSGTVGISWLVSFRFWSEGVWKEHFSHVVFEYLPPVLAELFKGQRWKTLHAKEEAVALPSVSIIIPVLNEAGRLHDCLSSIDVPANVRSEIILVDGGSDDASVAVARTDTRVRIVTTEKGRGVQITRGTEAANGAICIVLHADTRLDKGGVAEILRFCAAHPYIVGGAVASRFDRSGLRFRFITMLNNFRARFTGISFGDQVQFFRRAVLNGRIPEVKLMEDVEISMLLKEQGPVAVLPSVARVSTRRWENSAYTRNMFTVITLTALYLVRRRFGLLSSDNADFYRAYYGTK